MLQSLLKVSRILARRVEKKSKIGINIKISGLFSPSDRRGNFFSRKCMKY